MVLICFWVAFRGLLEARVHTRQPIEILETLVQIMKRVNLKT